MINSVLFNYFEPLRRVIGKDHIKLRKNRVPIAGLKKVFYFKVGDIVEVVYLLKNLPLIFSGICIAIRKKRMVDPNTSFILRNIVMQIGIELTFSFYYNRVYKLVFLDYKRKFYTYKKKRLFFIRNKVSRNSKV